MANFGSLGEFRAALDNLVNNTGRSNPSRTPKHVRSAMKVRKTKTSPRGRSRNERQNPNQMFDALDSAGFEASETITQLDEPRTGFTTYVQQLRAAAAAGNVEAAYELRDLELKGEQQRRRRKKKRKKAGNNPRTARNNMAVRVPFQGQMIEFDTPQEAAAFVREMGGAPPQAAPAYDRPPSTAVTAFGAPRPAPVPKSPVGLATKAPAGLKGVEQDYRLNAPYSSAATLLGGQKNYCPGLRAQVKRGQRLSNQVALRSMGLTPDKLFKFLGAVDQHHPEAFTTKHKKNGEPYRGIVREQITPQVIATAHRILAADFGVTCPTGFAETNPYGYGQFW